MTATATQPADRLPRNLSAATYAEILFSASLRRGCVPTGTNAILAMTIEVKKCDGIKGCVARVATEYGEHPELAVPRMRRALAVVATLDLN